MNILVLGATGGTGRAIVRQAQARGHLVTALVRTTANAGDLAGARLVQGDALDANAISRALEGCDGVISALGTAMSPLKPVTLLSSATRVLVDAMRKRGVRRLVCITGVGAGDSRGHGGFLYDRVINPLLLRHVYADKDRQEAEIRASDRDWIIVRPVVLTDKPATGEVEATTDLAGIHGGGIPRADVAAFVVGQLDDDRWLHRTPLIRASAPP